MNKSQRFFLLKTKLYLIVPLLCAQVAMAQSQIYWEAFNDYRPEVGVTSDNATGYDLRITGDGGILKNIQTGQDLPVTVTVEVLGDGVPDDFGANSPVNVGSPADKLFSGKVVTGNSGLPGVRANLNTKLILHFTGLNPARRYNFAGTVSRGGNYNDRWSLFTIEGADAYVNAHQDGSVNKNIFTKETYPQASIQTNQVALNSGDNKAGSLVYWSNIDPGADGAFSIVAEQYTGVAPFGNPSAAAYGYGLNAIYLSEIASTGNLRLTENPANQNVPAGTTVTIKVAATSTQTITYQWQKAAPGSTNFSNITGATQASYTTPVLSVSDNGAIYRCLISSGSSQIISTEATVLVDGTIPSIVSVRASVNFNAIYVTFSEPMKLDMLANMANYSLSGGLSVTSAVALDSTNVRLLTSKQNTATRYSVTVNKIEDVAGNQIPANASASFMSCSVVTNAVGTEIWYSITGGAVTDLRNNSRYPLQPDVDYASTNMNSESFIASGPFNTYGGRLRAWLTPEVSGQYEFFLRCDDAGEFRISMDDKFDLLDDPNITPDATDSTSGDTFQESGVDTSTSVPIQLEKGKKYAIQAIWKESNGSDYCQVAWRLVGDSTPADQLVPIPGKFLSYFGPTPAPPVEPMITKIALINGKIVVEWTGNALQSSEDLKNWTDEAGAASPFSITPSTRRFYRAKN